MLSAEGGVEIEAVAESDPDAIAKIWIDPVLGRPTRSPGTGSPAELNPAATENGGRHLEEALPPTPRATPISPRSS